MNKIFWLVSAALISTHAWSRADSAPGASQVAPGALLATTNENSAVATPPQRQVPASQLRTVPLVPGPAIVSANRVNVRGQARLRSEVVTRMTNGEPVMVLEEIQLRRSAADEPSAWAKIVLPEKAHPWVHAGFVDASSKAVTATKLNLRSGPGENYSVLGTLQKGEVVREIQRKGDWIEIEAPATAYAFIAAQYLTQEAPAVAATPVVEPQPQPVEVVTPAETTTVSETPAVAMATEPTPVQLLPETGTLAEPTQPGMEEGPTIEIEEAPLPRVVQREGIVRGTFSIQAPTQFELISPETRRPINYLYTSSTNLDLSRYKGLHIIVTGEEGLDKRWRNTPVLTIQRIQVLD
jgi:uncharacterized protein YgiM (DUF1202 family)